MNQLIVESITVSSCATNCYLCFDPDTKRGFILDPGDSPDRIKFKVSKLGFTPELIVITHGHFDHIGAALELKESYGIKIMALDKELDQLADSSLNMTSMYAESPVSIKPDIVVTDGQQVDICGHKATIIHTPGHTPGGMCVYFADEDMLLSGDTLFCESLGRYDFPGGSGRDIISSIVNKLFTLPKQTVVFPGHGEETTIEHELVYNPVARFIGKI